MAKATIRKRPRKQSAWSDAYCTPKWFADHLCETRGPFALDPCSNERSHIIADWSYGLHKGLDGLRLPWRGDIFKNYPYSTPEPWQLKLIYEMFIGNCTEAVVLAKLDPSTDWWKILTWWSPDLGRHPLGYPPDIWPLHDRLQFDEPPEARVERERLRLEAQAARAQAKERGEAGPAVPPVNPSNNFCSVVVHRRGFMIEPLRLEDFATRWRVASAPAFTLTQTDVERRLLDSLRLNQPKEPPVTS
jgi:hypothetical protein